MQSVAAAAPPRRRLRPRRGQRRQHLAAQPPSSRPLHAPNQRGQRHQRRRPRRSRRAPVAPLTITLRRAQQSRRFLRARLPRNSFPLPLACSPSHPPPPPRPTTQPASASAIAAARISSRSSPASSPPARPSLSACGSRPSRDKRPTKSVQSEKSSYPQNLLTPIPNLAAPFIFAPLDRTTPSRQHPTAHQTSCSSKISKHGFGASAH